VTVDKKTEAEIRRLFFGEHWKKGTIVAQLGVHDDVVARVLGPTDLVTSVPSDKTAFISFDGNRYSVRSDAADRVLRLVASDTEVRLLDGDRPVGTHARSWGKNHTLELPEHRAALIAHKPRAHDGKGRDRLRAEIPRIDELLRLWLEDGRYVGSLVGRTCKLLDLYGKAVLTSAVEELLAKGSHDYGALAILCEKRRTRPRRVLPLELAPHVVDRDVIPHDLGGYDDDDE
jgi:hypothetical protein